jgi:hypothetical protein
MKFQEQQAFFNKMLLISFVSVLLGVSLLILSIYMQNIEKNKCINYINSQSQILLSKVKDGKSIEFDIAKMKSTILNQYKYNSSIDFGKKNDSEYYLQTEIYQLNSYGGKLQDQIILKES